jgi:hypothetical protein
MKKDESASFGESSGNNAKEGNYLSPVSLLRTPPLVRYGCCLGMFIRCWLEFDMLDVGRWIDNLKKVFDELPDCRKCIRRAVLR